MKRLTYDLHIHSCLSPCGDNDNTPANIVGMAVVAGLDAIAIADHNSCRNLPAARKLADVYGIILVPAMELTTMEEVHVLCYFPTVEQSLDFSRYVEEHSMYVENNPELFGDQLIYNEDDELVGHEDRLLHTASDISFDEIYDILKPFGGVMVPAHINKATTSVLSNLGFFPEDSRFTAAEIQTFDRIGELKEQYPYLRKCHILTSSDAHYLKDIQGPIRYLHVEECSCAGIIDSISHYIE
jgi:hypothetical protein